MSNSGSANRSVDVAIVGAGPYGLSVAAHLAAQNVNFRIFGRPMQAWTEQMPRGMHLKSDGFASSLSDPAGAFTLEDYCKEKNIPYADSGLPVPIEVFSSYALEFQKRYVPHVEDERIVSLRQSGEGFEVELENGEVVKARRVVIAVGIRHFRKLPPVVSEFPLDLVTHSSDHSDLSRFKGQEVIVLGAGASALDTAAILNRVGAKVNLIARSKKIRFHDPPSKRTLRQRMRAPKTGLGPGWKVWWCVNVPSAFHFLPADIRFKTVLDVLAPAPGWFVKDEVAGKVPLHTGTIIDRADRGDGKVTLTVSGDGGPRTLRADHIISATGYRVDLTRLAFMDSNLLAGIKTEQQFPVLSNDFQTSVPGLYFVGASAAARFGPLMFFVFGTDFVAKKLSKHLASSRMRHPAGNQAGNKAERQTMPALDSRLED
jgi:thioredoxin reductase